MADEIRVQRDDDALAAETRVIRPTPTDPARQPPAGVATGARVPDFDDPEEARARIDATRARMSGTIDEIEGVLVRKKEQIQHRLDVFSPIRENPWQSMGIALGAGLVLGLLTGGSDEDDEDVYVEGEAVEYRPRRVGYAAVPRVDYAPRPHDAGYRSRTELDQRTDVLEERTRRLLAIAREQEEEIRRLRGKKKKGGKSTLRRQAARGLEEGFDEVADYAESSTSRLGGVTGMVADGIVHFVTDAIREMLRRR